MTARVPHKEIRRVLREAEGLGWVVVRRTKHIIMRHPDVDRPLPVPCTPRDPTRVRKQMIRRLHSFDYTT